MVVPIIRYGYPILRKQCFEVNKSDDVVQLSANLYVISEMDGKTYGENGYGIPVLIYEELARLLLWYNPWNIVLQVHQVAVEPLLDKLGIDYKPEAKYQGLNNLDLGKPEMPIVLKCC